MKKFLIIGLLLGLFCCEPERSDDPIIPGVFPDFTINITSYPELLVDDRAKDISLAYPEAGARGIIIYRKNATTFLAFETTCSFQPADPCATVGINNSNLFMENICCESHFNFEGKPTVGLAWRPLLQYRTSISGTILTITDDVLD